MKIIYPIIIGALLLPGCQLNHRIQTSTDTNEPNGFDNEIDLELDADTGQKNTIATDTSAEVNELFLPIKEFKSRITKKPFGVYITPQNSPIPGERFRGFHTGVDVEYDDISGQIPVVAITDGIVVFSGWVSGYGGVTVIKCLINDKNYLALYGHLNSGSLLPKNSPVKGGEKIGVLGQGGTNQTDGERKHLHFAVYAGTDLNFKGYVNNQKDLNLWIDPLSFYP